MKKFIVAILSFHENDIKQFKIEAESEFDAAKKGMVEFTSPDYRKYEIDFQNYDDFPADIVAMDEYYANGEIVFSVVEVSEF